MKNGFRAAILGCGMIAGKYEDFSSPLTYSHAKAYFRHPAFNKIGVVDNQKENANNLAAKCSAIVFDDIDHLLKNFSADVISICTPDDSHFFYLEKILSHAIQPKVIFCEKPICQTVAELSIIKELETNSKTKVIVNHSRRFDLAHQQLKSLIENKNFGDFIQGHVDYYGGWRHIGVHLIDILQYLLGTVFVPEKALYRCASKYGDDPTLDIEGKFGSASVRFNGFPEPFYQIIDMALMFEKGQIKISNFGKRIDVYHKFVNEEQENCLYLDLDLSGAGMIEPITHAVSLIAQYLDKEDHRLLDPYGLSEARLTMETLWKGEVLYAGQSH